MLFIRFNNQIYRELYFMNDIRKPYRYVFYARSVTIDPDRWTDRIHNYGNTLLYAPEGHLFQNMLLITTYELHYKRTDITLVYINIIFAKLD